jgi:tricorn protease
MVAEVATGALRRLTWLGSTTMTMLGWADATHVLVGANAGEFEVRNHVVKSVGLDGSVERLRFGRASGLARHHSGVTALSTPFSRPPGTLEALPRRHRTEAVARPCRRHECRGHPRRHRGPKWQRLLREDEASLTDPLWVGDSLVFTSDRAATFPHHASGAGEPLDHRRPGHNRLGEGRRSRRTAPRTPSAHPSDRGRGLCPGCHHRRHPHRVAQPR